MINRKSITVFFVATLCISLAGCGQTGKRLEYGTNTPNSTETVTIEKPVDSSEVIRAENTEEKDADMTKKTAKEMFESGEIPQPGETVNQNIGSYSIDGNSDAEMKLSEDGTFAYYIGENGGAGEWKQDGACVKAIYTDYNTKEQKEIVLNPNGNGLTMYADGVEVLWEKK